MKQAETIDELLKRICGRQIKCTDALLRTCLRESGHTGGCNPFSNNPPSTGEKNAAQDSSRKQN